MLNYMDKQEASVLQLCQWIKEGKLKVRTSGFNLWPLILSPATRGLIFCLWLSYCASGLNRPFKKCVSIIESLLGSNVF